MDLKFRNDKSKDDDDGTILAKSKSIVEMITKQEVDQLRKDEFSNKSRV